MIYLNFYLNFKLAHNAKKNLTIILLNKAKYKLLKFKFSIYFNKDFSRDKEINKHNINKIDHQIE